LAVAASVADAESNPLEGPLNVVWALDFVGCAEEAADLDAGMPYPRASLPERGDANRFLDEPEPDLRIAMSYLSRRVLGRVKEARGRSMLVRPSIEVM
jgi:hypothetical protein